MTTYISTLSMRKILKSLNAKRISHSAEDLLATLTENFATEIALHAIDLAEYSRRDTIKDTDILFASKLMMKDAEFFKFINELELRVDD